MSTTITTPITFTATDRSRFCGVWAFHPADPLAVHLTLWSPDRQIETWQFCRESLGDGFLRVSVVGDVGLQVRHGRLVVDLRIPPVGRVLVCDSEPVWEFLARTREAVPQCCSGGNERLRLTPSVCINPACVECRTVGPALDRWLLAAGLSAAEVEGVA